MVGGGGGRKVICGGKGCSERHAKKNFHPSIIYVSVPGGERKRGGQEVEKREVTYQPYVSLSVMSLASGLDT